MDTKGIKITGKDLGFVVTIILIVLGFTAKYTTLQNKVEAHDAILSKYNIPVMNEKMDNLSSDVGEVKDLMKEVYDYLKAQ